MKKMYYYYIPKNSVQVCTVTAKATINGAEVVVTATNPNRDTAMAIAESLCKLNGPNSHWAITVEW